MVATTRQQERLARVFKALGDETRLRLVAELARCGEVTCGRFAEMCACSPSALTYHQHILSDAGLITVRRSGQYRVLALQHETLESLLPGFVALLSAPERSDALEGREGGADHDSLRSATVAVT